MAKPARKPVEADAVLAWRCPRMKATLSNPATCEERRIQARKEFKQRRGVWMVAELNACRGCPGPEAIK